MIDGSEYAVKRAGRPVLIRRSAHSGGLHALELGTDLGAAVAAVAFDDASKAKLVQELGAVALADEAEAAISAVLTVALRAVGFVGTGFTVGLSPGVPSEELLTFTAPPAVVALDAKTLAVAGQYVLAPDPAPVRPLLPPAKGPRVPVAIQLDEAGFQQVFRNPAVRKLARDSVAARHPGDPGFLETPAGRAELEAETPPPVGTGTLTKALGDLEVAIEVVDLWLEDGRVAGAAHARGTKGDIGFRVSVSLHATLTIADGRLQFASVEVGQPLGHASWDPTGGVLPPVTVDVATLSLMPLFSGVTAFLLAAAMTEMRDRLATEGLGAGKPVSEEEPKLPDGMRLETVAVSGDALTIMGSWLVPIDDPRPFAETARFVSERESRIAGPEMPGSVPVACRPILGILMNSTGSNSRTFGYTRRPLESAVKVRREARDLPLPVTAHPCTLPVVDGSPATAGLHHPPPATAYTLATGDLAVTAQVWSRVPPLDGTIEERTFTIRVEETEDGYTLHVPPESASVRLVLTSAVTDARGVVHRLYENAPVDDELVRYDGAMAEFRDWCATTHRDLAVGRHPLEVGPFPDPAQILDAIQNAIRTGDAGVADVISSLIERQGPPAIDALLVPSKLPHV